ncbi:MAG TPA: BsuPI-related putative proteinase inhibitor [Acidimicrobiales bacterium]|nr:BsuPI-related putative proteinase inhibitor [Acidimicrobiales bacterium]
MALSAAVTVFGLAGCGDDAGSGPSDDTIGAPPSDAGDPEDTVPADGGDAVLIPPTGATSPTSGPPNTDPLAAAAAPDPSTCEGRTASPASSADDLELRVVLGESLPTGRVRWALEVRNRGDAAITLVYPTAQEGDVVLRRGGEETYRWSAGRSFAQAERCQVIGAAQVYRLELSRSPLDVEPGDYALVAPVGADPAPGPVRLAVTGEDPDGG